MTSRELRKQRREAERKARKLEYRQNRNAVPASPAARESSFVPGEGTSFALAPGERSSSAQVDEPAVLSAAKTQVDEPAVLSGAKTQPRSGPTGPRSPEGKAISSGNSLKHGLASGRVIIPGEDPAEFEALLSDLIKEHAPVNETESLLVQQMAQSWWLMQRAIRIQNDAFSETRIDTHKLALFLRYQTTYERAFYRALNSLIKLQKEPRKPAPEFVSQRNPQTAHENGFVSQNRPHAPLPNQFVSQRSGPTAMLQADL